MKRIKISLVNFANGLTLSRFAAAPVMLWFMMELKAPDAPDAAKWLPPAMLALMIVTLLTDLFDGMAARSLKTVTNFGKIMDPVADSTFFMTLMFALSASSRFHLPIWMPIIVLYREVAMHVLRRYAALRGIVLAAKISGKAKMFIQSVAMTGVLALICFSDMKLMTPLNEEKLSTIVFQAGLLVVAVNILSIFEYLREVPALIQEWREAAEPGDADNGEETDKQQ